MGQRKGQQNKRFSKLEAASDVLQSLLGNGKSGLAEQFQRWRLWRQWNEVVGEILAKNTCPVGFQDGILIIWVDHPARIQDLYYVKQAMIDKINEYLGRRWVKNLKFTTDRKAVPKLEESEQGLRDYLSKSLPNGDEEPPRDR
ncbi:MAG: DUF721 domain-containing protein [Bdellovibrionales bacterium]|nr:DUF721 domain-containing protein [Bdellovibrionales bacterium]